MKTTLLALLAATALGAAGCGGDDDPDRPVPGGKATDRAFIAAMIPHHESAVEMAEVAERRAQSGFVRELGARIAEVQEREIAMLRQMDSALERQGVEVGELNVPRAMRGMDHDASELEDAEPFDQRFIEMMIPHHEGAIAMAEEEIASGAERGVRTFARHVVKVQRREIDEMREHLGAPPEGPDAPPGGDGAGDHHNP